MRVRFLVSLLSLIVLTGCKPGSFELAVDLSKSGAVNFTVEHVKGNCGPSDHVELKSIWVGKINPDRKNQTVWYLTSTEPAGHSIKAISYGTLPDGFTESQSATPLIPGQRYEINISGHACSGGIQFIAK